jgi:diacylglycerol O-acyltransferase / wax synthase
VFSLVLLELPVGVGHALERLMRVKLEMDRIKASAEAGVGWAMVSGMGLLQAVVERPLSRFYAGKATLVLTNVPGPRRRLHLAGVPIRRMAFWEPESGGIGVGVSIFSYAGEVTLGAIADANLVERPGTWWPASSSRSPSSPRPAMSAGGEMGGAGIGRIVVGTR